MKGYLKGAYILTLGIFVSRIIGILFVFPFANMVSETGLSLFSYAYVPYTIFIDLATLGIPMGLSKIVAKYNAQGDYSTSRRVFHQALVLMLFIGALCFVMMNVTAPIYAKLVLAGHDKLQNSYDDVVLVLRMISYALLVIPSVSVLRGYLQGHQRMWPTAISQIVEQLIRVSVILIAAYIIIVVNGSSYVEAIAIAVLAATFGAIGALLVLIGCLRRLPRNKETKGKKGLIKEIFKYALPYAFFGISFSIYQLIDSLTYNKGMLYHVSNPEVFYGIYSFEIQKLIFIPIAFAIGMAASIMPAITAEKDLDKRKIIINRGISIINYWLFPIMAFTVLFGTNLYALFYSNYEIGPKILMAYAFVIPFIGLNNVTNGIMQGVNLQAKIYLSLSVGIAIKALTNYLLIVIIGYQGAIISTLLGISASVILNFIFLHRAQYINYRRHLLLVIRQMALLVLLLFLMIIGKQIINYQEYSRLGNGIYLAVNAIVFFSTYLFITRKWKFLMY